MRIEVYADIACPLCYIGMRRLRRALSERPKVETEQIWRPYQLQPDIPPGGIPFLDYLVRKFGDLDHARDNFAHVAAQGRPEGIEFNLEQTPRAVNTRDAHRLVLWAGEQGRAWEMAEALFQAHLSAGVDLGDREALLDVCAAAGFDRAAAAVVLDGNRHADMVAAAQETAVELGIRDVPFYVFNRQLGVSGAQPYETFLRIIDQIE